MTNRLRTLAVQLLLGLLLIGGGGWLIATNLHSADELRADSERRIAEHVPTCDGRAMRPGDSCLLIGKHTSGYSYEDDKATFDADHSPERLAAWEQFWRVAGGTLIAFGVLCLTLFALLLVEVVRHGAREPRDGRLYYQRRLVFLALAVSLLLGAGWWLLSRPRLEIAPAIFVLVGLLCTGLSAAAVVSAYHTRVGRRRWAARRGYTYRRFDPDAAERFGVGGRHRHAYDVVTGEEAGRPFALFDYAGRNTHLEIALPAAVPAINVRASETLSDASRLADSSAAMWRDGGFERIAAAVKATPWRFSAQDLALWTAYEGGLRGAAPKRLEQRLRGLAFLGDRLVEATSAHAEPGRTVGGQQ